MSYHTSSSLYPWERTHLFRFRAWIGAHFLARGLALMHSSLRPIRTRTHSVSRVSPAVHPTQWMRKQPLSRRNSPLLPWRGGPKELLLGPPPSVPRLTCALSLRTTNAAWPPEPRYARRVSLAAERQTA